MDQHREIKYPENDAHWMSDQRFFVFGQTPHPAAAFASAAEPRPSLFILWKWAEILDMFEPGRGLISFAKPDSCVMAGYTAECRSANYGRVARGAPGFM